MRSAVDEILRFNRRLDPGSLAPKLQRLTTSPFGFFRGTYHLFCFDILEGPFRKWPSVETSGAIIGDLHTENFGSFRGIDGQIVYDINDFDETTTSRVEYDLRRLAASLLLAALENKRTLGDGVNTAETCLRGYLDLLRRMAKAKTRAAFTALGDPKLVEHLRTSAGEKRRADMFRDMVEEDRGLFRFRHNDRYLPLPDPLREQIAAALPRFWKTILAPKGADPARYTLQDVAFRIAGCGSLGRQRYALLFGKGKTKRERLDTLRLIEWKDSLDSSLDSPKPHMSKNRAREVVTSTIAFQLTPKRYLGWVTLDGRPMQAREIGANDDRFHHATFAELDRFQAAARTFGHITARAHLLASLKKPGPRSLLTELAHAEDRWVNRTLAFATAYAHQVHEDFDELRRRSGEVAGAWGVKPA